jgi:phenylalanyl-tRNA synthetase beta chain
MKFRIKDLKNYISGNIDFNKLANLLTLKSFETVYNKDFLEVDILPNRYPDSSSLVGLAKEIGIILNKKIKEPIIKIKETSKSKNYYLKIIKETDQCFSYFGKIILNIKNQKSPQWLREFVNFYGFNSINFLVDLSNFVMIEYGAPLHLFDLDKIKGNVYVRISKKGEKFLSLDDKVYLLEGKEIVIADDEKILALAGIKGSRTAEVTLETKNILIEAAVFDPYKIYETSRRLGLKTEASFRFERKVSPYLSLKSLNRLCQLIEKNMKAEITKGIFGLQKIENKILDFDFKKIAKLSGIELKIKEFENILKLLSIKIIKKNKDGYYKLKIPLERLDIENEQDLVEEIIRIYGLNNIPEIYEFPKREISASKHIDINFHLKNILISMGINEGYNYNFCSDKDNEYFNLPSEYKAVEVLNPLSENFKYFNFTLIFNLLKSVYLNQFNFNQIKLFQIEKTGYFKNNKVNEEYNLAIIYAFKDPLKILKYLKGVLSSLFEQLGIEILLKEKKNDNIFSVSSEIILKDNLKIGVFGLVSQKILQNYLIDLNVGVIEINLDFLYDKIKLDKKFVIWPTFPTISRDISFLLDEKINFKEISDCIYGLNIKILKEIKLIDVYFPEKTNLKSFTLRLIFAHPERNLREEEVDDLLSKIIDSLVSKFNIVLR